MPKPFTAVILTALPVEYKAIRAYLTQVHDEVIYRGTVYERGLFLGGNQPWEVNIAEIGAGNSAAAAEAEKAIGHFDPSLVFFVGVAGGVKDVKLGDVVAATKIYGYASGKAEAEFHPRPSVENSSHALEQRARAEARKENWLQRLGNDIPSAPPRAFVGPIAAGEVVVASIRSPIYKFIRSNYGDALAVEMEGRGFLEAAHVNHPVQAIVIRGISDLISGKYEADTSGSQEIASRHASAFAFELLAKFAPGDAQDDSPINSKPVIEPKPVVLVSSVPSSPPAELSFPIFEVPYRQNPNFTGREEIITSLHHNFSAAGAAVVPQVITGLGGIGKTQIAVEYAYQHASEYDLIWWMRAEEAAALSADYLALATRLQLPVKTSAEQLVFTNIVRHWLEDTSCRWLLIYDNVEDPKEISELLPTRGNGHILITSQSPEWRSFANVFPRLQPFTPEEARKFLFKRTGQDDQVAADNLSELLGRLPLALGQAGAFIDKLGLSVEAYTHLYEEQRQDLWQRETPPLDYKATVTTTWELAFQRIKESSPAGIALLNLCAFLAPEDIPLSIFSSGKSCLPSELAVVVENQIQFEEAVAALYQYSLVERQGDNLSIHRLVQEVVRERLGLERISEWVEFAVTLMNYTFLYDQYDMTTWPVSARLLPHALAVATYSEKYSAAFASASVIWQRAGEYLRRIGEYPRARVSIENSLRIRKQLFSEDHELFAQSLDYLGELYQEQGNYAEAYSCHEQALVTRQKTLGQDHPDTALSFYNLGSVLQEQGKYEQALEHLEAAFAINKQVLGEQHPRTANSLNNLGTVFQAQGKYEQAREYYEAALAIYKQVLGERHPHAATGLNNLGSVFYAQGKYEEALKYFEVAVAINKQVLGEQHPDTTKGLSNLGLVFHAQGKYEEALKCFEVVVAINKQVLGDQHPNTAKGLNSLAGVLQAQGKYVPARNYLEQALKIYENVHGDRHPTLVTILSNLAQVMVSLKQFESARRYITRALAICRETNEQYRECERIKHLLKTLPGPIGRGKKKKK